MTAFDGNVATISPPRALKAKRHLRFEEHRVKKPRLKGRRRSEAESTDKCVCAPKTGQTTKTGRKAGVSNREKEKSEPS
jgi:hypothetical protein